MRERGHRWGPWISVRWQTVRGSRRLPLRTNAGVEVFVIWIIGAMCFGTNTSPRGNLTLPAAARRFKSKLHALRGWKRHHEVGQT